MTLFIELSQIARREGILALESKVQDIDDPFFRTGLRFLPKSLFLPEKNVPGTF